MNKGAAGCRGWHVPGESDVAFPDEGSNPSCPSLRCPRCGYTDVLTLHEIIVGLCTWYGGRPHQVYSERDIHVCANRRYCGHQWSPDKLYIEGGA